MLGWESHHLHPLKFSVVWMLAIAYARKFPAMFEQILATVISPSLH